MSELPTCLLIVTAEVDPAVEAEWNRWYDAVHLPDALRCPGVRRGRRYVSSGQISESNAGKTDKHATRLYTTIYELDSPEATKLPVRLAVALLKDRDGVIDINLPVSGSINDPEFSVGGLVFKAIINLIGKALTSPFSLFSGSGGSDLSQALGKHPKVFERIYVNMIKAGEASGQLDTILQRLAENHSLRPASASRTG